MITLETRQGAIVPLTWRFADIGLDAASIRGAHISLRVTGRNASLTLNNLDGSIRADLKQQQVKASLDTETLRPGVYDLWLDVLKADRSQWRDCTHTLTLNSGR